MNGNLGADGKVVYTLLSRQSLALDLADITVDGRFEIFPHVEDMGLLFLQFRRGKLIVTAGAYVGLIPLTPRISFDIRPKLPVSNLARVIDTARRSLSSISGADRLYLANELSGGSVLEFLAANLVDAVRPIASNGPHKEYLRHSERMSHPRGRIEITGTMRAWSRGQFHKVQAQRFDQSADVAPNRVIKAALHFLLLRVQPHAPESRRLITRVNSAYMSLPEVIGTFRQSDYDVSQKILRLRTLPAGRVYYYRALEIALLILSNRGFALQQQGSDILLETFVINFDDLFEEYLRRVLQLRAPVGLSVKDGNKEGKKPLFDDGADQPAQPDAVLAWLPTGRTLIGEVKNKEWPAREDINQAITYALSYRADRAVLIHQRRSTGPKGLRHQGTIRGIRLEYYAFDLGAADLEGEEAIFALAMFDLVRSQQTAVAVEAA